LRREKPDRPLDTNVEFFTAILLDALAIPRQPYAIFAVAAPRDGRRTPASSSGADG